MSLKASLGFTQCSNRVQRAYEEGESRSYGSDLRGRKEGHGPVVQAGRTARHPTGADMQAWEAGRLPAWSSASRH